MDVQILSASYGKESSGTNAPSAFPLHRWLVHDNRTLLTGATGYVGGRLLTRLEEAGRSVRCLARRPEALRGRVAESTEVLQGDVLAPDSLTAAFAGIDTAYYLVHALGSQGDFEAQDREAAANFAEAARVAGVRRIIYLGGLGDSDEALSRHLRSRQETGEVLRAHHPQVLEFRASIVIGSGSLSFEMLRALVERLPVMICPRWVRVLAQPIAVEDLLNYLMEAAALPEGASRIFEIGGPDRVSYGELMQEYAWQRGLRRWMIPVPGLTPHLSSLWLGLVTPLYARVGRKLVESLRNPTLVSNDLALQTFALRPRGVAEAMERALGFEDGTFAQTRWSDALSSSGNPRVWGGVRFGSRLVDSRTVKVSVNPEAAFAPIRRIGGATGWYYANALWSLRGFLDLLVDGVGILGFQVQQFRQRFGLAEARCRKFQHIHDADTHAANTRSPPHCSGSRVMRSSGLVMGLGINTPVLANQGKWQPTHG